VRTNGINQTTQKLFFLNYNTGYCGSNNNLFKTTNAGLNWNNLYSFGNAGINGIYFVNLNIGWVGLGVGKVGYTTNGGINWVVQQPDSMETADNYGVYFINNLGWTGSGHYRSILKSTDYGQRWGYQIDTSGSNYFSIVDTSHGWSDGTGLGFISRTTNGGGQIVYAGISKNNKEIPKSFKLFQNFPNPFNSQTTIRFSLSKRTYAKLKIYDAAGKEMNLWESGKLLEAGMHELSFNANNLSSGVYFYELTVSDLKGNTVFRETKKMILIK
jgi:photosystem II stability/assembly factor-like uncharacterized protein